MPGRIDEPRWRIDSGEFYNITDKEGNRVPFIPNDEQWQFIEQMHTMNVILKARQRGFTTLIQILMLDACLFNRDIRCGTIAHNLQDAQTIFRDKVRFVYDQLPPGLKARVPILKETANELMFANNSSIRVGTSHRGGTLNFLHISEYGKLCAKFPEKALEVRTGALNTVQAGNTVFIESTAEGQAGHFYDLCEASQSLTRTGAKLSALDWKFHFYPWWRAPEYRLDPDGVIITEEMRRYFDKLETSNGVTLDDAQKAWYVKKSVDQGIFMKREYPATPQEAFEAAIEGAYYGDCIEAAETQGRVGRFEYNPDFPVHTAWDIGRSDYTSIWYWQRFVGRVRLLGFYQNAGEGMPHYAKVVKETYERNGWSRKGSTDYVPHDARVTEWGSDKTRVEQMIAHGLKPNIPTKMDLEDGINAVRALLPICEFDAAACDEGIKVLKAYRKDWNEDKGCWTDRPRHDWASHGADAMRYLACAHQDLKPRPKRTVADITRLPTLNELVKEHDKRRKNIGNRI